MAKALTAKAVENSRPGPPRRESPDGHMPGLYFVVQPSGAKSWAVRYRHKGISRKLTLGSYPLLTLAKAREQAGNALKSAAQGRDPAAEKLEARRRKKEGVAAGDLVPAVVELFLARHVRPNHRSAGEVERLLKRDVATTWADRSIQEITRRDVVELLDAVVDRGSPIMANRVFNNLRRMLNWAEGRGMISVNPIHGLKPPSAESSRDRVLSDDEIRWFWAAVGEQGFPFGPLFQLLLLTGQRRDEVSEMRWSEIDLDGALWTLPGTRSKNRQVHEIPLSPAAGKIIRGLPTIKGDLVFTTNGKTSVSGWSRTKRRFDTRMLAIAKEERGESTEIPGWRLHDLRRTVASGMARLGIYLPVIEKVMNHTSGSFAGIVGVYQRHNFYNEKQNALAAWASFIEQLVTDELAGNVVP